MATVQASDIAAIFDKLRDQRDEARAQAVASGAEVMRLIADLGDCQDALQDWQVAAGTRQVEIDALRAAITEMATRYKQHEGRYGGTGIADELESILTRSTK